MKFLFAFLFVALFAVAMSTPAKYTDRFDNINLDEILNSDRLLNKYVDCLMDRGRCTPDAKSLKENLPDALSNHCGNCTKKQKQSANKVIRHFVNKRKDLWKMLEVKYDPKGIYGARYKDAIDGKTDFVSI